MGNIEIRDQQSVRRRTQIFSDRKSYDAARSQYRKSLTQRYEQSRYSPIRFSKLSQMPRDTPLTERKPNTLLQHHLNNLSPILNQQTFQNSKAHRQQFINPLKLKNIQISQHQQQNLSSQKTGKIVSNSNKRAQNQRRSYLAFRQIMEKQKQPNYQLETKDIIKKVRNFNDFLNQIKRKLKQDQQETLLTNKSRLLEFNRNHPSQQRLNSTLNNNTKTSPLKQFNEPLQFYPAPNIIQKSRSMRRIEVALKLQNQKIELQKYRKLVERQLSKTHSIQNISLCTKNSGEKILTIQYESILNQNRFPQGNSSTSLNKPSERTLINKILENKDIAHNQFNQNPLQHQTHESVSARSHGSQKDQAAMLKRLKLQYQKMLQNVLELGRTIESYEMNGIMAESQVVDGEILIQESDFSKKGSQFSQRKREFSQRASNISQHSGQFPKEQTKFRQKQSQSRMTERELRERQQQLRQKQSQSSKQSIQHRVGQLDRTQSQCTKKAESQRSINKMNQVSDKKSDDPEGQIQQINDESQIQYKKERGSFEWKGSRASQAVSQSSIKQVQVRRQGSGEMRQEIVGSQKGSQFDNRDSQFDDKGSQVSKRGSQLDNKGSQASNKSSHTIINQLPHTQQLQLTQLGHQASQDISFANQSSHQPPISTSLQQHIQLTAQKSLQSGSSKQKIARIESSFDRLNDLQQEYQETDREVCKAIGQQSEGHSQIEEGEDGNL